MSTASGQHLISIIIVNFRQKEYTLNCVRSIAKEIPEDVAEIIVVNNSPEEDLGELNSVFREIKLINNTNKGFSQANNLASKVARGKYLIFLNADTILEKDFSPEFKAMTESGTFTAGGLRLFNPDGSFQLSFWKENTFLNEIINKSSEDKFRAKDNVYISSVEKEHDSKSEVDWVSGASLVVRKDVFDSIGGFDEKFFLFYEDADICKRLNDKGHKIFYLPIGKIIHYKGENVNENFKGNTYYYSKESQIYYYQKHNSLTDRLALRIYLAVKFALRYLAGGKDIDKRIFKLAIGVSK